MKTPRAIPAGARYGTCSSLAEMVLIQLPLPTTVHPDGPKRTAAALNETRRELAAMFEGLTAYLRSPAKGVWNAPDGHTE
jgi:hypothetical protein